MSCYLDSTVEHPEGMDGSVLLTNAENEASELCKRRLFKEAESQYDLVIQQLESIANESNDNENLESQHAWKKVIAKAYNARGLTRYKQVCFDEATADFNDAISYDPEIAVAYYNRGTIRYRLCQGQAVETGDRLALLQKAFLDFKQATDLEPEIPEFFIGLENCEKELQKNAEDDGNALKRKKICGKILKWEEIPTSKLVQLLFLLDNGDKSSVNTDEDPCENTKAVDEALAVFNRSLRKGNNRSEIVNVLKTRVSHLYHYLLFDVRENTEIVNLDVRKRDEDLLTFVQACKVLDIKCFRLERKTRVVEDILQLNDEERQGTFFIYAENLRMKCICDQLSSTQVYELYEIVMQDESLKRMYDEHIRISPNDLETTEGLKETLFFYIIRWMEVNDKLNRIYTYSLEFLLTELKKRTEAEEERKIVDIIRNLSTYPVECKPSGLCVVFCVTQNRDGATGEIEKVENVFGDSLGYAVQVHKDPSCETLKDSVKELSKKKYRFYDSVVFWFMAHGSEKEIELIGDNCDMQSIIDSFCKLDNFRKKPKIFFMTSCKGNKPIPVKERGNKKYTVDGIPKGKVQFLDIPEAAFNITAVYYEMDRLIAHATLPNKYAFRDVELGSVYVDTVCQLLKEQRGDNITNVLEKANNAVHRILFNCKGKFEGEAKQACYYESTFQKSFKIPSKK